MAEKNNEKKHDLREGMPPSVSIDSKQEHSVYDAERRGHGEGNEVRPNPDQSSVPEGQNNKQGA